METAQTVEDRLVEAGDVLFVAVNIIRRYGLDAEQALKASNAKFERRFRAMESLAAADGQAFDKLDLEAQEHYWQRVKRLEKETESQAYRVSYCPNSLGLRRTVKVR